MAVMGLHVPFWFLEGDAVAFETGASKAGRGRVPDFSMKLNAQVAQKGIYSYPKAMFGSYKDFVPNHYELGYYLVASTREQYGALMWNTVLEKVSCSPIHPNPFSAGIKKVSGLPERKLYAYLMSDLKNSVDTIEKVGTIFNPNKDEQEYINYYKPQVYKDGLICYKTSLSKISGFVYIDGTGKEHNLHKTGYLLDNSFSLNGSTIIWNELRSTRWANKNSARIAVYDLDNRRLHYIVNKGRIFSSKLSPDGKQIVSAEITDTLTWQITIREGNSGSIQQTFCFDTIQVVQPNWSPGGNDLVFIAVGDYGKSLGILNIKSGFINWILTNQPIDFQYPIYQGDNIVLKGVYNQVSNYYRYNLKDKNWEVISSEPFGVGEASIENDTLYFTTYTEAGFKIKKQGLSNGEFDNIEEPEVYSTKLADNLSEQEQVIDFAKGDSAYSVKKYSRLAHLINIHSWVPAALNINNMEAGLGVSLMAQNALSTSFLNAGLQYYNAENRPEVFVDYAYKGFYPEINTRYTYSPYTFYNSRIGQYFNYDRHSLSAGLVVPLIFNRSAWYRQVRPSIYYGYDVMKFNANEYYNDKKMHSFRYGVYAQNMIKQAYRDLKPRWGQAIDVQYQHAPFDTSGFLFSAQGWFYFPGIMLNHSTKLSGGYQEKESDSFGFSDRLIYPRGYMLEKNDAMVIVRFDYAFPFLYPDLNVWEYLYVKRLKANLFYDNAQYSFENKMTYQQSVGVDITADLHAFRFIAPIQLGFRYARKLTPNQNYWGVLFQINFDALN